MSGRRLIVRLFVVTVLLIVVFLPGFVKYQELLARKKKLEAEIKRLSAENERLWDEQYKLQHDPVYVEGVARERLGVAREGELIYKVKEKREGRTR